MTRFYEDSYQLRLDRVTDYAWVKFGERTGHSVMLDGAGAVQS